VFAEHLLSDVAHDLPLGVVVALLDPRAVFSQLAQLLVLLDDGRQRPITFGYFIFMFIFIN
jgi:hypothetical protein